jgi:hypothetical protein
MIAVGFLADIKRNNGQQSHAIMLMPGQALGLKTLLSDSICSQVVHSEYDT